MPTTAEAEGETAGALGVAVKLLEFDVEEPLFRQNDSAVLA